MFDTVVEDDRILRRFSKFIISYGCSTHLRHMNRNTLPNSFIESMDFKMVSQTEIQVHLSSLNLKKKLLLFFFAKEQKLKKICSGYRRTASSVDEKKKNLVFEARCLCIMHHTHNIITHILQKHSECLLFILLLVNGFVLFFKRF